MKCGSYTIKSYIENEWKTYKSLCQAIQCAEKRKDLHTAISVVGAGGKTTVIRRILKECQTQRRTCTVSTTTHIQAGNDAYFLGEPSLEIFQRIMLQYGSVWMGKPIGQGKLAAFPEAFMQKIRKETELLLLEADGAKHLPVKAPAAHEPMIPSYTDIVLNVYGMSAIGKKIKEVCFRKEQVCAILEKTEEEILCPDDIVKLARSELAGRKQVSDAMQYHVILNQADDRYQKETAMYIAENIMNTKNKITGIHITRELIPEKERW